MIDADRQPSVLARMLGSMLQTAREVASLSYDEAATRLGCDAQWLIRVETGFAGAPPERVARILVEYGVREAIAADSMIDMARRVATPPPWLGPHTSRMTAAARDVLLVEAEATLAQVHGVRLIPSLVQSEGYFRQIAPGVFRGCDVDQEWVLGFELASGDLYDLWTRIETTSAADQAHSQAILERHLAALS